jgi:CBS-domain-containing membrane protein
MRARSSRAPLAAVRDLSAGKRRLIAVVAGAAGAAIAIGLWSCWPLAPPFPSLFVPFATSIVLVARRKSAASARRRHLIATVVGLLVVKITGSGTLPAALAVGVAIVTMHLTRSFHPPAGIDPLVVVVNGMSLELLLFPVAVGACLLAAFAFVWHNRVRRGSWPKRWW